MPAQGCALESLGLKEDAGHVITQGEHCGIGSGATAFNQHYEDRQAPALTELEWFCSKGLGRWQEQEAGCAVRPSRLW